MLSGLITKDDTACMEYVDYHRKVVQRYQVILKGWPQTLPFKSPRKCSSSIQELEDLLQCLRDKRTYWKQLTDDELTALEKEHKEQIEHGKIIPPAPRRRRSDLGKKRKRSRADGSGTDDEEAGSHVRKPKKRMPMHSATPINSDSEDEDEPAAKPSTLIHMQSPDV